MRIVIAGGTGRVGAAPAAALDDLVLRGPHLTGGRPWPAPARA